MAAPPDACNRPPHFFLDIFRWLVPTAWPHKDLTWLSANLPLTSFAFFHPAQPHRLQSVIKHYRYLAVKQTITESRRQQTEQCSRARISLNAPEKCHRRGCPQSAHCLHEESVIELSVHCIVKQQYTQKTGLQIRDGYPQSVDAILYVSYYEIRKYEKMYLTDWTIRRDKFFFKCTLEVPWQGLSAVNSFSPGRVCNRTIRA